jgi:hypothetical protein
MVSEHCVALRFMTLGLDKNPLEIQELLLFLTKNLHTHYLINSSLSHFVSTSLHFKSKTKSFNFNTSKDFEIHPPLSQRKQIEGV